MHYFGDEGDRLQMMLNFPVNQRLYYAFATGDPALKQAIRETMANVPRDAQWVQFLRSHDELDLGRSPTRSAKVFEVFALDPGMQLYNRGIRRRLAPMLGNDRRRLELAYSLLFLPGTPMIQYGDEIGMGEDPPQRARGYAHADAVDRRAARRLHLGEKGRAAGDRRRRLRLPEGQRERAAARPELVHELDHAPHPRAQGMHGDRLGECEVIDCDADPVLVLAYRFRKAAMVSLHNFSDAAQTVHLRVRDPGGERLVDLIGSEHSRAGGRGRTRSLSTATATAGSASAASTRR